MIVKTFKLNSGEEILAEVLNEDSDVITIIRPVTLSDSDNGDVSLVPWLFSVNLNLEISFEKSKVFLISNAASSFVKSYNQYKQTLTDYLNTIDGDTTFDSDLELSDDVEIEQDEDSPPTIH